MEMKSNTSKYTIILRFLGTTPNTSSMSVTYASIIYQLSRLYNIECPSIEILRRYDNLQKKDILLKMLNEIQIKQPDEKIVFFLDSIDQLNKADFNLEWMLTKYPSNVKFVYTTLTNKRISSTQGENKILAQMKFFGFSEQNFLEISALTKDDGMKIINSRLEKSDRILSKVQNSILNELFDKAELYPLYIKIIFDIASTWKSFTEVDINLKECLITDDCIRYLFSIIEKEFGSKLVSKCLFYLTVFDEGISDLELEDILSLDDDLLYEIFEYHEPPIRRFPIALWKRIKIKMENYLTHKEIDRTEVYSW